MGIKKLFVLLGLMFFVSCSLTPIFKEGDCIVMNEHSEHPELYNRNSSYQKIKRVGKKTYLVDYRIGTRDESIYLTTLDITSQRFFIKVNCPANLR